MNVTYFKKITNTNDPFVVDVYKTLEAIKNGKFKDVLSDYTNKKIQKKDLPLILWSGEFSNRSKTGLLKHSGLFCLDYDKIEVEEDVLKIVNETPHTLAYFKSPSGNGLKVIVLAEVLDDTRHEDIIREIFELYDHPTLDKKTIDVSRACFVSYDPNTYINKESEAFKPNLKPKTNEYKSVSIKVESQSDVFLILVKWFEKKYQMQDGDRNNSAFVFAASCNDYGVEKNECLNYLLQYEQAGFDRYEIETCVESGYKQASNFGTKHFEDSKKVDGIKKAIASGKNEEFITSNFNVNHETVSVLKDALCDFWTVSNKGKVSCDSYLFKAWLEKHGFFKHKKADSIHNIVQVKSKIAKVYTTSELKTYVLKYLEEKEMFNVYNFFADNLKYFEQKYLDLLTPIEIRKHNNNNTKTRFYFKNKVVDVYSEKIEEIDYIDIDEVVWDAWVIKRDYVKAEGQSDFETFIKDVSGNNIEKYKAFCSSIGFLINGFNDRVKPIAIALNDCNTDVKANGGSGKGIVIQGIRQLRKSEAPVDGKQLRFDRTHVWNGISFDDEIVYIDDVQKNFDFKNLYSALTTGFQIEKKGKDAVTIPWEQNPKVVVSTNYGIDTSDGSTERRLHELELSNFFNKDHTPYEKYGKQLLDFDNEPIEEWGRYLFFMFGCLRYYQQNGLQKDVFTSINEKKLNTQTSESFTEFFKEYRFNYHIFISNQEIKDFKDRLVAETNITDEVGKRTLTIHMVKKWLSYAWDYYEMKHTYVIKKYNGVSTRGYEFNDPKYCEELQNSYYENN